MSYLLEKFYRTALQLTPGKSYYLERLVPNVSSTPLMLEDLGGLSKIVSQLVRASSQGLRHAKRHRFEHRPTHRRFANLFRFVQYWKSNHLQVVFEFIVIGYVRFLYTVLDLNFQRVLFGFGFTRNAIDGQIRTRKCKTTLLGFLLMSAVGYVTLFESDASVAEFVIPHQINI